MWLMSTSFVTILFESAKPSVLKLPMSRVMSSMRRELSSLEYRFSHSTQAALYTHARQNQLRM